MSIQEHRKFSSHLDPAALFDTIQEAQRHERKVKARQFIQQKADREFTRDLSDEFTNEFVDGLIQDLCKLMEWEL